MIIHTSTLTPHSPHEVWPSPVPVGNHTPQFPTGQGQVWWKEKPHTQSTDFPQSANSEDVVSVEQPLLDPALSAAASHDNARANEQRDDFERAYRAEYERAYRLKELLKRVKAELPITPVGRELRSEIDVLLGHAPSKTQNHQPQKGTTK